MTPDIVKLRDSLPTLESIIQRLELELVDDPTWNEPSDTSYLSATDRENPDIAANVEAMRETNRLIAWFGRDAEGYLGLWRGPNNRSLTEAPVVRLDSEGQYSIVAATVPEYLAIAMPEDEFASTRDALTAAGFAVGFNPDAIWGALDAFDDDPNAYRAELYERARVARGLPRTDEDEDEDEAGDDGASDVATNGHGREYDEHAAGDGDDEGTDFAEAGERAAPGEEDEGVPLAAAGDDEDYEDAEASARGDDEDYDEGERAPAADVETDEDDQPAASADYDEDEIDEDEGEEAIPARSQLAEGTMPAMIAVSAELEETEFDFGEDEDEDEAEEDVTGDRRPVAPQVPAQRARAATVPAKKSASAKPAAKKASKTPAKKAAGKAPAKKAATKKAAAKKAAKPAAKKAPKAAANKASKAPAKKAAGKASAKKAAKPATKKPAAKKAGKAAAKKRR